MFDDSTKAQRGITSDSPAASKKVFSLCRSLILNNVRSVVVSLGRGSTSNTGRFFKAKVARINSVPTIFLPYWDILFLSNVFTLFVLPFFIFRLNKKKGNKAYIFYNRIPYYIIGLLVCFLLRCRSFLDLEDGDKTTFRSGLLGRVRNILLVSIFDFFCKSGVILACSALGSETGITNKTNCYGVIDRYSNEDSDFDESSLRVLFGGSICPDTGSEYLLSVIKLLQDKNEGWVSQINFVITGKGSFDEFLALEQSETQPKVYLLGSLSQENYKEVLKSVQIGLALKPIDGALANTTFPSKVMEYASNKILVLTTNVSDIKDVLSTGAIYLETNDIEELVSKLKWIVDNRMEAKIIAQKGFDLVAEGFSKEKVGLQLKRFLFEVGK